MEVSLVKLCFAFFRMQLLSLIKKRRGLVLGVLHVSIKALGLGRHLGLQLINILTCIYG